MKSLIQLFGVFPILVLLITTSANFTIAADVDEKRELSSFNRIEIAGAYTITLVQGGEESVLIKGDTDIINKIITKVEKGSLVIYHEGKLNYKGDLDITINFKTIDTIESSGVIKLSSQSTLKLSKLEIEMSGSTNSDLDVVTESLKVGISGSGKVNLKGSATTVELEISGTGHYNGEDLTVEGYEISISGVGKASVNVSKNLDVEISGTGSVSYKGNPNIKQEISGMGSLNKI